MKQVLYVLSVIWVLSACNKRDDEGNNSTANRTIFGRYTGTFQRTGMKQANVSLNLLSNYQFDGSSDTEHYPAICNGTFTFDESNHTLTATNTCAWTADFDWTLIFDGDYHVRFYGDNSVRIWKDYNNFTDEYLLDKYVR